MSQEKLKTDLWLAVQSGNRRRAHKALGLLLEEMFPRHLSPKGQEKIRRRQKRRELMNREMRDTATNLFQRWTDAHDLLVMEASIPDKELAGLIGRTWRAVRSRRTVLNARRRR